MEQYLESMITLGRISQLPEPSTIPEQQCELFISRRITGILLCSQGYFMAVLEGQPLVLQSAIKQTIKNEKALQVIHKSTISERNYRHWNIHVSNSKNNTSPENFLQSHFFNSVRENLQHTSTNETIKDIVAYYYCEYIVSSFSCYDYRLANIA